MSKKLDTFVIKTFLQAVEELDQPREDVNLRQLCNKDIKIYASQGSEQRRLIQVYFANLKRLLIDKYLKKLDKVEVAPSATTNRLS